MTIQGVIYELLLDALLKTYEQGHEDIRSIGEYLEYRLQKRGYVLAGHGLLLDPDKHFATVEVLADGERLYVSTEPEDDEVGDLETD